MDKSRSNIEYFLLFYLIATSGFVTFTYSIHYIIIGVVLSAIVFKSRKLKIDKDFFYISLLFLVIQIGQSFIFNYIPVKTYLGLYGRLVFAYFTVKILGNSFFLKYLKIMKLLMSISLLFFIISVIFPSFSSFFTSYVTRFFSDPFREFEKVNDKTIIIYNFFGTQGEYNYLRNSGPFWEPGAFAGYIILGVFINFLINNRLFNFYGVLSLVTLLTTFSTTGYLAYFIFVLLLILLNSPKYKFKMLVNFFLILVLASVFILVFLNVDFLGSKIQAKISEVYVRNLGGDFYVNSTNRFSSALKDLIDFSNYPFTGLGRNFKTRFKGANAEQYQLVHRNNGVTNLLATYGIFIFVLYFYLVSKGFEKFAIKKKHIKTISLILLFTIGFSEVYFNKPFFYSLMFISTLKDNQQQKLS